MLLHKYVRAIFVVSLLLAASPSGSVCAEKAEDDWLRGSDKDLQIRLSGEVFEANGRPATGLQITCHTNGPSLIQPTEPMIDGHRFEVWIPASAASRHSLWLKAASTDTNHVSYTTFNSYELRQAATDGLRLSLKPPTRQLKVTVTDQGQPVAGATVQAEIAFGIKSRSQTDARGIAQFDLLPDQNLYYLTAWTDDHRIGGFSFNRTPTRDPNENEHQIELSRCRDQRLRFVDEDGAPVPGVDFVIQVATPAPHFNFLGTNENSRLTTDAAGEVVYRWFPDWERHYFYPELVSRGWVLVGEPETREDAVVFKLKKSKERKQVRGRVTSSDTGVGGFYVSLRSFQGERENQSDVASAITNPDGTFTVDVLPDARYCAYVLDSLWVGDIIDLIPYQAAFERIEPPVLSVSAGQEVEVLATAGPLNLPEQNLTIRFQKEYAYTLQEHENGRSQMGVGGPQWWVTTDHLGRATTHALPGELKASVYTPRWRAEQIVNVRPGETAKIEFYREYLAKRTITGRLVLAEGVEAKLEDAEIQVGSLDSEYKDRQILKCEADGTFSLETLAPQIGMYAVTQDGRAAGSIVFKDLDEPVEIPMQRTLAYEGQLLGVADQPLVDHGVEAYIRIDGDHRDERGSPSFFDAKRVDTRTDESGNFTLLGMPSDTKISVFADSIDGSRGSHYLGRILLHPNESRPRTVSRLADTSMGKPDLSLAERYRLTLRDCGLGGYRLMLIVANGAGPVGEFINDHFIDARKNQEVYGFMQIPVIAGQDGLDDADEAFLKERGWQLPDRGNVVAYAIDGDGKVLGELEIYLRDANAGEAAADFVHRHAPPIVDAQKKWVEAFAEAKGSNRRVWARVSQRYCGPCFAFSRWLDDQRELLENDYVMLKIDNVHDRNGADVADRLTRGELHGIPFHAIFDQNEELLIDSAGPLGNIGYPSSAEGKRQLRKMLLETRRNLTDFEIDQLVESVGD